VMIWHVCVGRSPSNMWIYRAPAVQDLFVNICKLCTI
jgi:hypothetical protein